MKLWYRKRSDGPGLCERDPKKAIAILTTSSRRFPIFFESDDGTRIMYEGASLSQRQSFRKQVVEILISAGTPQQ